MRLGWVGLLWIAGAAWAAAPDLTSPPAVCDDAYAGCREDCTIQFGTSVQTRNKMGKCLRKCTATHDTCLEKYLKPKPSPHGADAGADAGAVRPGVADAGPPRKAGADAGTPDAGSDAGAPKAASKADAGSAKDAGAGDAGRSDGGASTKKKDLSHWDADEIK